MYWKKDISLEEVSSAVPLDMVLEYACLIFSAKILERGYLMES